MADAEHIPYPRIQAAIRAGQLSFLLAHADALGLPEEAELCRLIAQQRPHQLEPASVRWIRRFAATARGQRREDYATIVCAFDRLPLTPERSVGELKALCAARGAT
ncbi:MAG: hypothetical protein ACYCUM_13065 [Solirubrobacteraceae bacterium]